MLFENQDRFKEKCSSPETNIRWAFKNAFLSHVGANYCSTLCKYFSSQLSYSKDAIFQLLPDTVVVEGNAAVGLSAASFCCRNVTARNESKISSSPRCRKQRRETAKQPPLPSFLWKHSISPGFWQSLSLVERLQKLFSILLNKGVLKMFFATEKS